MLNFKSIGRNKFSSRLFGPSLTIIVMSFCISTAYGQQQGRTSSLPSFSTGQDGSRMVTISYGYEDIAELSGGQFQIHYDPQVATLVDQTACLSNIPETHQSNFSVCKDFPKKGIVQFAVLDLGQNRPIGAAPLGSLTFRIESRRTALAVDKIFKVKEIGLAGPDGRHLKTVPVEEKDRAVQISISRPN